MQRVSELIGKSIMSAELGQRIGEVSDVLLDPQSQQALGLVIAGGAFRSEQVLAYEDIQTIGRDAVVTRSGAVAIAAKDWRQRQVTTMRSSALRSKRVITTTGRALGEVHDVILGDDGRISSFEVTGSKLGGLVRSRFMLPHTGDVTLGADAVLVGEGTASTVPDAP